VIQKDLVNSVTSKAMHLLYDRLCVNCFDSTLHQTRNKRISHCIASKYITI